MNHLRPLGYDALDWGRGHKRPSGNVDRWLENLSDNVLALVGEDRRSFSLVGRSLGELYAREVAKRLSSQVRQVITMGTVFNGTTRSTNVGWLYELLNGPSRKADTRLMGRLRTLPQVPSTSICSRDDGVVAWQSCLHDRALRFVEDVDINGSHLGMGWNRDVLVVVADRLTSRLGAREGRVT